MHTYKEGDHQPECDTSWSWSDDKVSQLLSKIDLSQVRPLIQDAGWYCDDRRYFEYALKAWERVIELTQKVSEAAPLPRSVRQADEPDLYSTLREREFWSDCVKVYSAMAVEAWINFYGVAKLTEPVFAKILERRQIPIKLRVLLKLTAAPEIPVMDIAARIGKRRNALVHPKTIELGTREPEREPMPGAAHEALSDAVSFFQAFVAAVPDAASQVPPEASKPISPIPAVLHA